MVHVLDLLRHWEIPSDSDKDLSTADVIVTHEFGDQKVPSLTTKQIVGRAVQMSKKFNKPLICQFPGDKVAEELGVIPFAVIKEHQLNPSEYLDTEEVNRQVGEICKTQSWRRAVLVTHPHHLWRASRNLQRHGIAVFYPLTGNIPYDSECSRGALRTPYLFIPRELLARALYFRKRYL